MQKTVHTHVSVMQKTVHTHVSVMQKALERYLVPEARQMVHELTEATGPGFRKLNDAVSPLPETSYFGLAFVDACCCMTALSCDLDQVFQTGVVQQLITGSKVTG